MFFYLFHWYCFLTSSHYQPHSNTDNIFSTWNNAEPKKGQNLEWGSLRYNTGACLSSLSIQVTICLWCVWDAMRGLCSMFSLCQCCISNTDKTHEIAVVRSSGRLQLRLCCLSVFICVIKSHAQQGKWKPYSPDKLIWWFDTSGGPHRIHTTPTDCEAAQLEEHRESLSGGC